jgi:hypothetical protein
LHTIAATGRSANRRTITEKSVVGKTIGQIIAVGIFSIKSGVIISVIV